MSYVWSAAVAVNEYVVQILDDVGLPALILASTRLISAIMRGIPHAAYGLLLWRAGIRAMDFRNERRREAAKSSLTRLQIGESGDPAPLPVPRTLPVRRRP